MRDVLNERRGAGADSLYKAFGALLASAGERQSKRVAEPRTHGAQEPRGVAEHLQRADECGGGGEGVGAITREEGTAERTHGAT